MSDYAEIDVQETSDGEIVLMHDTNLKRTTGLNASIWTLTYDEISQLDAGVRFTKNSAASRFRSWKKSSRTRKEKST